MDKITIKQMEKEDILAVSKIHKECFPSDFISKEDSIKWITCNFNAYPRGVYYIAKIKNEIVGYILWIEKGGFRKNAILELEQISVKESWRGKEIGTLLIKISLNDYNNNYILPQNRNIKIIEVTTGTTNEAQKLYKRVLHAKSECIIKDLYEGDETIMIVRYKL